jgi:hypothetical protein
VDKTISLGAAVATSQDRTFPNTIMPQRTTRHVVTAGANANQEGKVNDDNERHIQSTNQLRDRAC